MCGCRWAWFFRIKSLYELNQLNYDVKIIDNKNIKQKGYFKCDIKDYKS